MNIGFIGLGNMGSGMASHLLTFCQRHGHSLAVFDLNHEVVAGFVAKGATTADSIASLVRNVQLLFTSLPSAVEINLLAQGDQGILRSLPAGAVWFETSTNELAQWNALKAQAPASLTLVDAPVTGGAEGAAAGTLTMLLGVEQELLDQHADLLSSFTAKAVRMGPGGAGYVAKLCQLHLNYLVALGIGETLMLGAKADLELTTLHEVLHRSCGQSYVADRYIPMVLDGSYDPSFTLGLASKDMRLITELGKQLNVPLQLADTVYASYQSAAENFGADQPHLKIVKLIEDAMHTPLRSKAGSD